MSNKVFLQEVMKIAIPVALQSMLQSSFSMIDQIMVGRLGEDSVAAVEIAGRPGFVYSFVLGAVATVAAIMISQYIGKGDKEAWERSICVNALTVFFLAGAFWFLAEGFSERFMRLFSLDERVVSLGEDYLRRIGFTFLPLGLCQIAGTALRCRGKSSWPLYVGALSAVINTVLNYGLIFGHLGLPALGVKGAALASVISQVAAAGLSLALFFKLYGRITFSVSIGREGFCQYMGMLGPVVANEFLWSVGQSVNTWVYGHMGKEELAGMAITGSVQGLTIGALSGISQAAGILIGKRLGEGNFDRAYEESKKLCLYGFFGTLPLSALLIFLRFRYVSFFLVSPEASHMGAQILLAFAVLLPIKVQNMILGGGIVRSGGKTKYIMAIDMMGTWLLDVPLAFLAGIVLHLPLVWVYFILSQEELARLLVTGYIFRSRKWMVTIR